MGYRQSLPLQEPPKVDRVALNWADPWKGQGSPWLPGLASTEHTPAWYKQGCADAFKPPPKKTLNLVPYVCYL